MSSPIRNNDQQKTFALFLCLLLAYLYKEFVWDPYFYPAEKRLQQQQAQAPAVPQPTRGPADEFAEPAPVAAATAAPSGAPAAPPVLAAQVPLRAPSDAQVKEAGSVVVETDQLRLSISLLGGRVTEYLLKDYKQAVEKGSPPLNMVEHVEYAPYPLGVYSGGANDAWTKYEVVSGQQVSGGDRTAVNRVESAGDKALTLKGVLPDGREISKTVVFRGQGYMFDVDVLLAAPPQDASKMWVEWARIVPKDSPSFLNMYEGSGYVWFDGQRALREAFSALKGDSQDLSGIQWMTIADKYFMGSIISHGGVTAGKLIKSGELYRARLSGDTREQHLKIYAGPKHHRILENSGFELKRNLDFGRTSVIALPLLQLLHMLHGLFGNYGLAIVMLTIIVKLVLYPLNASSFKQMKSLQDLGPEIKRIRETITDKQQQQLATMQLYKERKVNPLGGCLPILLQMPVFIGLYSALLLDIGLRHAPFAFWINDLSAPEKLQIMGITLPVMVILFVISMLVQQWTTPSTIDPAQKKAMLIVPLVFGFMFASMPAGLTLYWLTNNLISIGQMAGFRKEAAAGSAFRMTFAIAMAVFAFAFIIVKIG